MASSPVWLITGVSSGFGMTIAQAALAAGQQVVGTVRNRTSSARSRDAAAQLEGKGARVLEVDMDAGDAAIASFAASAVAVYGRVDVLVNNAGYAVIGAVEDLDDAAARRQLETNLFGPLSLIRALLPAMRSQQQQQKISNKRSVIVNISSTAGLDGNPACALYSASKFALEGMSEGLAREIAPLGINTVVVEPGAFRTDFQAAIKYDGGKDGEPSEPYHGGPVQAVFGHLKGMIGKQTGDPVRGADVIVRRVLETMGEERDDLKRVLLGSDSIERMNIKLGVLNRDLKASEADARSCDFPKA